MKGAGEGQGDEVVGRLADLFRSHPAWTQAAALLSQDASSNVRFGHRPGELWHVARMRGVTRLARGPRPDADLELTFPPAAVERLAAVEGGIGRFALTLFDLALESDPALHVDVRILAPFGVLVRRGYLRLLVAGGPPVVAWGARHGVRTLGELRRFVKRARGGLSGGAEMEHAPARRRRAGRSPGWKSRARRKRRPA